MFFIFPDALSPLSLYHALIELMKPIARTSLSCPPSSLFPQVPRADQHGRRGKTSATTSQIEKEREEDFSSIKKAGLSLQKFAWLGLGELGLLAGSSRSSSHLHV